MKPFELIHLTGTPTRQSGAQFLAALALVASCALSAFAQATPKPTPIAPPNPEEINEARQLLGALGFWVIFAEEKADGHSEQNKKLDASLRHALVAFQKLSDRPRTGTLTHEELQALRSAKRTTTLESGYAHIEVDLVHQVLLVVENCDGCLRILPISSGSGAWFTEGGKTRRAVTPTGRFQIQRKIAGWRKSPLGLLYYPNYIYGGIAIHGNPSVPPQPASHGCIRIPMFASKAFADIAIIGLPVIVHNGTLPTEKPALSVTHISIYSGLQVDAVGHRIVQGGHRYREPQFVTPELLTALQELTPLNPGGVAVAERTLALLQAENRRDRI